MIHQLERILMSLVQFDKNDFSTNELSFGYLPIQRCCCFNAHLTLWWSLTPKDRQRHCTKNYHTQHRYPHQTLNLMNQWTLKPQEPISSSFWFIPFSSSNFAVLFSSLFLKALLLYWIFFFKHFSKVIWDSNRFLSTFLLEQSPDF